jgi:ribonuclease HII
VWQEVEAQRLELNTVKANSQSSKMYELFCLKHYERLFKLLDADRDGLISADRISLVGIEDAACEIMQPIFEELQETNESMSFIDFVEKLHFIMSQLSLHDRSVILKRQKDLSSGDSEFKVTSRQSIIGKRSEELAMQYRAAVPGSIYDRQLLAKQVRTR